LHRYKAAGVKCEHRERGKRGKLFGDSKKLTRMAYNFMKKINGGVSCRGDKA
jgi:hypothetical protein